MAHSGLNRFLRPRSVAIVGASADPTSIGGAPLALLDAFGYSGKIHLVSRRQREIGGRACVASVDELPDGVDAAILAVPRDAVLEVVDACVRRRIGGAVVFASGFAEVGPAGIEVQREMAARARAGALALAGPNCLGLVNFVDGAPLTFGAVEPAPTAGRPALAIIAQSGAMSFALLYAAASQGIALSYVVSTGNEATLGIEDYLEAMVADSATRAIALLVEQIRDPRRFLASARAARVAGKGLCLLHTGSSARGRDAAKTHTGALAGDQAVIRALLAREAVAVVDSLDELVEIGGALARCPPVPAAGGGVAIVTDSGAFKSHALDVCERLGLDAPEPTAETSEALRAVLPSFATVSNPVDITGHALNQPSLYGTASAALLADPGVGALLVAAMPGSPAQFAQQVDAVLPVVRGARKPVLYSVLGGQRPLPQVDAARLREAEIPLFRSPERALAVARHLLARSRAPMAAAPATAAPLAMPAGQPTEHATKHLLSPLGLASPAGGLARTLLDARQVAARIGYPLVLKAQSAQLPHKSDAGGVLVGIANDAELATGWARLAASIAAARPGLVLEGVLVERMAPPGVEVVVAARRDPQWGTVVLVGLGGIWIEALGDVRVLSADAEAEEIHRELTQLRGYSVLAGRRGHLPADARALVDAIRLVGRTVAATPALAELELNPLLVLPEGQGVLVLDALAVPTSRSEP